ncbi:dTDP-4-dehydrorhamnose 3,5-epimerase [Roseovarius sp. SCSIO 43702]|uniref:dTDP-4-dehydrorhamnose 3,5-epimerase n=1 Tax=Roseovarius sp. SCSIO 43702 TaxID=2823043 RepID=UPI001C73B8A8|nr:dTDP-4-dehydrorhamnose 3,5-epimerase [Roseovarius sp. SCSIO 43702]QYX55687.1 dTDP-4-dehydrorhamnose 3,5-epimerase [Roseovarius sp. SCSIO 43702]
MRFTPLSLAGAYRVELEKRGDDRGFFARMFCENEFAQHGLATRWVQVNSSYSAAKGTLRGLHFQRPPSAEAKLVRCLRGAIFDVIVDLRAGSATYGRHETLHLDDEKRAMVYIPPGFAHGFQTLTDDVELLYFHSAAYDPRHEGGLHHADGRLAIAWPLPPEQLSERDQGFPFLTDLEPIEL